MEEDFYEGIIQNSHILKSNRILGMMLDQFFEDLQALLLGLI
jgi:hypothetical protein